MILINKDFTDYSLEGYASLATLMGMVYGAEILAYRVSEALEQIGSRQNWYQDKKRALNLAKKQVNGLISNLETAFDKDFSDVVMKEGTEEAGRRDAEFHALAAEILKLDLLFMVKSEGMDHEKRQNIFKMLSNFKGGEGSKEIDLQGLLKFYRFDD